jgi:hypothetical protein
MVLYFFSKKDYFWFALVFILIDAPGRLFISWDPVHILPYFALAGPNRSIFFGEIFLVVSLIKAIKNKIRVPRYFFKVPLLMLGLYFIFEMINSFLIGIDYFKLFRTLRFTLPFLLYFIIPTFFREEQHYRKFFNILFLWTFVVLGVQIFELASGYKLNILLGGTLPTEFVDTNEEFYRPFYSHFLVTLCFIMSLFYLTEAGSNKRFLIGVLGACSLIVSLSGTRGFILAFLLILILYTIFVSRALYTTNLFRVLLLFIVFIALMNSFPSVNERLAKSFQRLQTVESLVQGDITAQGTLQRLSERSPRVMKKFMENPIVGFGFSNEGAEYFDEHVANQTMLLSSGLFGYGLFLFSWLYFVGYILLLNNSLNQYNPYKKRILVFVIGFVGLFFIHSTSGRIFGYLIRENYIGFALLFFLVYANFIVQRAKVYNFLLNKPNAI